MTRLDTTILEIITFLLISCTFAETTTSRVIDLSYKHNLDAKTLTTAIPVIRDDAEANLEVDVSSSALGDEGVNEILKDLVKKAEKTRGSLIAPTNGVTPRGATQLIQTLLNATSLSVLDLSWNPLHTEAVGLKDFHTALEELLGNSTHCPSTLRLVRCGLGPAATRAMGKGLIHRYTHQKRQQEGAKPLSLCLCGNPATGDAGAAALAAALRFVATSGEQVLVFEKLDLSACDIGDAGVEALALALEASPGCLVKHLDLSNNRITERGAEALAQALSTAADRLKGSEPLLESLDLTHNPLGDAGAAALATCLVKRDLVPTLCLRSCHIHADGAAALGKAMRHFAMRRSRRNKKLSLDLSGNPFGVLRGKSRKSDGKYSASRLKSKASATAASYMNQGFSILKKGLKDVGVDMGPATDESDDDEDDQLSGESTLLDGEVDSSRVRCGGRALADAFADADASSKKDVAPPEMESGQIWLGLRHCYFDHAAADALANLKVCGKDDMGVDVELDVRLNHVLEDDMVSALHGEDDEQLREMAETHSEKMAVIRESQERAREAARMAASRAKAELAFGQSWNAGPSDYDNERVPWDSDEDYDSASDSY